MIITTDFKAINEAYKHVSAQFVANGREPLSFKSFLEGVNIPIFQVEESNVEEPTVQRDPQGS